MQIKFYQELPLEAKIIREEVFVLEQGYEDEFTKEDEVAIHLVAFIRNKAAGTCNFYYNENKKAYILRRLAVVKAYRKSGVATKMIEMVEEYLEKNQKNSEFCLHAQYHLQSFYEKRGFRAISDIEYEQGQPHIWMSKKIV